VIEDTLTLDKILKDFYIPSDARSVKDLFTTSKKRPRRGVLSNIPQDQDEIRIRRLLERVRKLRIMAKKLAEVD
jgi:hypothetical protein